MVLLTVAAAVSVPSHVAASPWEIALCPPYVGSLMVQGGLLVFVVEELNGDRAEKGRVVKIANPEGAPKKELERCGLVKFNAHHAADGYSSRICPKKGTTLKIWRSAVG